MSNLGKVLIQRQNGQLLGYESKLIYQHCIVEQIKTEFFEYDQLSKKEINPLSDLVVGSVESLMLAMQNLRIPVPLSNYYPVELTPFLHRSVWNSKRDEAQQWIESGKSIFVKPTKWKQFNGQVFDSLPTLNQQLGGLRSDEVLWLGEPVKWLSEYRIYVVGNEIQAVCFYDGDETVKPNIDVIKSGINELSAISPAAYAVDWGVLDCGNTALVEMGDAWATGAYKGISPSTYFNFLKTRWTELVATRNQTFVQVS